MDDIIQFLLYTDITYYCLLFVKKLMDYTNNDKFYINDLTVDRLLISVRVIKVWLIVIEVWLTLIELRLTVIESWLIFDWSVTVKCMRCKSICIKYYLVYRDLSHISHEIKSHLFLWCKYHSIFKISLSFSITCICCFVNINIT